MTKDDYEDWLPIDPEGFAKYILDSINSHWDGKRVNPTRWLTALVKERDEAIKIIGDAL